MGHLTELSLCGVFLIYAYGSKLIFDHVYTSTKTVIDEAFHLPQGLAYCRYNFETWDPKITTLPGLYLISMVLLSPFNLCDIYWLRFVNYLAGLFNLVLFYIWFSMYNLQTSLGTKVLSSLNLSLLPPLYFFSNLYYTDVISLSSVVVLLMLSRSERHFFSSLGGLISIVIRQTNIIWVLMVFGEYFLKHYCYSCLKLTYKRTCRKKDYSTANRLKISENAVKYFSSEHLKNSLLLTKLPAEVWTNISSYCILFISFGIFLIWNGGIVIGDKTAHVAVIHIPQLFYFSLFTVLFSWAHFVPLVVPFIKSVLNNLLFTTFLVLLIVLTVYFNTLVHPYLLADNRHYTFYIWTRFYQGIPIFRYIVIGLYLFGFYCMFRSIYRKDDISFTLVYVPCTIFVLVLQKMIEVRYFLIPFILFRLHLRNPPIRLLIIELLFYIFVNFVTLKMFFVKDIYWSDFEDVQKLIW